MPFVEGQYGLATMNKEATIAKIKSLFFHGAFLYEVGCHSNLWFSTGCC